MTTFPLRQPRLHGAQASLALLMCLLVLTGCGRLGGRDQEPEEGDLYGMQTPQRIDGPQWTQAWNGRWVGERLELEPTTSSFPRGTELTLGLTASRPDSAPSVDAGEATGRELSRAVLDIQNQGALVRGVHLSLEVLAESPPSDPDALEGFARWLDGLRSSLGDDFEMSWTVPWLEPSGITAEISGLRRSVDWFAVRTYGQPPHATDEAMLWDLAGAERRLDAASEADASFRSLIRVGGSLSQRSERDLALLGTELRCDTFKDFADRSESFFQFEGYFRQVFEADPRLRILRIGDQELSVGDRLRVNRTTVDHLRSIFDRIASRGYERHLGHLFLDVATDSEDCLSLDLEELALAGRPMARLPQVSMEKLGRDRYRIRLVAGSETTGLARTKNNFVDVVADEGTIVDVEMKGFVRFEFIDRQREVAPGLLGVGVRLQVPLLEVGQSVEAVIRTRAHRTGFQLGPRFISPTGVLLPMEEEHWIDGVEPDGEGAGQS